MKKLIIILGTVLLGAWIVSSLIMGGISNKSSLQGQANTVVEKSNSVVNDMLDDYNN